MTPPQTSVAELLRAGITITVEEAVAIALAALECQRSSSTDGAADQPLPETVFIDAEGSVVCTRSAAPPTIAEVAGFLRGVLPAGSPGVPGGLQYAIARALHEVDAPPFDSPQRFAAALVRFQTGTAGEQFKRLLVRAQDAAVSERIVAPPVERRRPRAETISNLRHALREADARLFEHRQLVEAQVPAFEPPPIPPPAHSRRGIAIGSACAAAVLVAGGAWAFISGRTVVHQEPPNPIVAAASDAPSPLPKDIVLEAAPRASLGAGARAQRITARTSRKTPPPEKKRRGFFDRLHMQWLRKAFS
jgi:hypothetical protein